MRSVVLLSIICLVAADTRLEDQGNCAVDGAEAISDLMDSTMFIWASIARCGHKGEQIKCEVNIANAIESVNSMINTILKAVDQCGDLHTKHKECGMAAGRLTKSMAGLTAATGGIVQKCPNAFGGKAHGVNWNHGAGAQCVVDLKSTAKALFQSIKSLMKINKSCEDKDSRKCASNALRVVGAFAALGEFMAGTMGHCTSANTKDAECAQEINGLLHHTTKVAQAGIDVSRKCEVKAPFVTKPDLVEVQVPRLYEAQQVDAKQGQVGSSNLLLGAFLPVTAIVSFVGGRFYGRRGNEDAREFMSDNEQ